MGEEMDGLISFYGSHHAMRAEKVLKQAGFKVTLIPGPRELSPNCGVALRLVYAQAAPALVILDRNKVQIEAVHVYRPRVLGRMQAAPATEGIAGGPRRFSQLKTALASLWGK
ncbi:MAG: DUF3343 domain-containing protein [Ardenticatenaceae bacterium]|nr:DUF3343 domain-containing protein [Ardenticatenaceae bacterium]